MEELDRIGWFPTRVTAMTTGGIVDPVLRAVHALSDQSKLNVMRKLETAIQAETIEMDDEERQAFDEKWMDECKDKGFLLKVFGRRLVGKNTSYERWTDWSVRFRAHAKTKQGLIEAFKSWMINNGIIEYGGYYQDSERFSDWQLENMIENCDNADQTYYCICGHFDHMRLEIDEVNEIPAIVSSYDE